MKRLFVSFITSVWMLVMFAGAVNPALADGSAPIAENLELNTYRNVSVSGKLNAYDPEDDVERFFITTEPIKGKIKLEQDGSFIYTPDQDKKGKDYFGYKAIDTEGNCSQEATVIIRIDKQKASVSYIDMTERAGEYASVVLSSSGIFTGEMLGGQYCFYPDKPVNRGEFYSMCLLASDQPLYKGVLSTGFDDDASIPYWMKEYAAVAAVQGLGANGENRFDPEAHLSKAEAAFMLNEVFGFTDVDYLSAKDEEPGAYAQACLNLNAVGVLDSFAMTEDELSREDAAIMLVKAIEKIGNK